ncbi:hypothetical protein DMH15_29530 [Streptomyces sp. WAC 06725]|uniref:hypothetical protein n=1 Tax=Streptomyces sp. WAC 06725 TaxID=2203209 RepID=UPI000F7403CC|nr:hypothetical protein [Streptomyces sp. WAC 06725]RSO26416.1 hypothetical protein DMH15_29530 [Streptomyces sp. WAC 06725]
MLTDSDLSSSTRPTDLAVHQAPPQHLTAPYIALRTGEGPATKELRLELRSAPNTWGLAFADETPDDRDSHDVLWRRYHHNRYHCGRPTGTPLAGQVHPDRLRETMSRLTCPVCNHPASQTSDGYLFLEPPREDPVEERLTTWPPVCTEHVIAYACERPDLRDGYTAIRSADPTLYGVRGQLMRFTGTSFMTVAPEAELPYGNALMRWVVADQLLRELKRITVVVEYADPVTR